MQVACHRGMSLFSEVDMVFQIDFQVSIVRGLSMHSILESSDGSRILMWLVEKFAHIAFQVLWHKCSA